MHSVWEDTQKRKNKEEQESKEEQGGIPPPARGMHLGACNASKEEDVQEGVPAGGRKQGWGWKSKRDSRWAGRGQEGEREEVM